MKFYVDHYRASKPALERMLRIFPSRTSLDNAATTSAMTLAPLMAILHYLGEIQGFSPEVVAKIAEIKKFYLIDEIVYEQK